MENQIKRNYEDLKYLPGLGNHHVSETLNGALPIGQNNPQKCAYNLYAELISGSPFTVPRINNQKSWMYRIQPSVTHGQFKPSDKFKHILNDFQSKDFQVNPNQLRWKPIPFPQEKKTFVEGLITLAGVGHPSLKDGMCIYIYSCNQSMENQAMNNSDGDLLIVPQTGKLFITTEFGKLTVDQNEICVIPRGIRFQVEVEGPCRGWVSEIYKGHYRLPELGPIGSNGLANPRDFEIPSAFYERIECDFTIINKFNGKMFEAKMKHSCFDVVAWQGTYYPFKYQLKYFCVVNSVLFDHLDPCIFTVLTAQSDEEGQAICDFVIFPPRWCVQEHTFRPPYYHRNTMSEFMGNIVGQYDAKEGGFGPGCSSLHSTMTPHGPEANVFEKASNMELKPVKLDNTQSFMFETCYLLSLANQAMDQEVEIDNEYYLCWQNLKDNFQI